MQQFETINELIDRIEHTNPYLNRPSESQNIDVEQEFMQNLGIPALYSEVPTRK